MVLAVSCVNTTSVKMEGCEAIRIPVCQSMPYNSTKMPNLLHHPSQEHGLIALEPFEVLMESGCSPYLVFFLCSLIAPMCTVDIGFKQDIPPCQHLCDHVRTRCEVIMKRIGFVWPSLMDCELYPTRENGVCLTPETLFTAEGSTTPRPLKSIDKCRCHRHPQLKRRLYQKRRFHYAIRGQVIISETFGLMTLTNVRVVDVFKRGRVPLASLSTALLWTNSSCGTCPRLEPGREYFMLGHEDTDTRRLIFSPESVALEWRKKYAKLVKKWEDEIKRS